MSSVSSATNSLSSTLSSISTPVSVEGSTSTNGTFTGTSDFSSELQSELTREVDIADLPIETLQNQETLLQNQSSALSSLNTDFTSLQTAVQGITSALNGSSYSADVSDSSVVSATLGDGATQGVYNIDVENVGSYSTWLSNTWDSSGSTANTYTLEVNGQDYSITATDNSADSVASAINSQYGSLVQATVVNVGSSSDPDERISLQSTSLGEEGVSLSLGSQSLTSQSTTGQQAEYEVNNSGVTAYSDSDSITISTGITLNLLGTGSASVTVSQPVSTLSDALSSFVSAYNQCATDLANQRGQSGGALQGQSIVNELQQALNSIADYTNTGNLSGSVNSLSSLGITMSNTGQMSYDELSFASTAIENTSAVNSFLGSATGGGFLETATNALNNMLDSSTGALTTVQSSDSTQVTNLESEISTDQSNVSTMESNLEDQLSQADSTISELEQEYSYMNTLFSDENTTATQIANGT